jgi:hypothetical protein
MAKRYILHNCDGEAGGKVERYRCAPCFLDWEALYPTPVAGIKGGRGLERAVAKREALVDWGKRMRGRLALVLSHIVTQVDGVVVPVTVRPRHVLLRGYSVRPSEVVGGERGVVTGFTKGARARMMRAVACQDFAGRSLYFVTLTYDGKCDVIDPAVARRHFRAFAARLERRAGYGGFLWRWEYQERGAAHFHLLVWSGVGGAMDMGWTVEAWHEITESTQDAHLLYGVRVDALTGGDSDVVGYLSKYAAKEGAVPDWHRGRMWGIRGDKCKAPSVVAWLPMACVDAVRRVAFDALLELQCYVASVARGDVVAGRGVEARDVASVVCPETQSGLSVTDTGYAYLPWHFGPGLGAVSCNFLLGAIVGRVLLAFCRENGFQVRRPGDLEPLQASLGI